MNIRKQLERAVHICIAFGDSKRSDKFNKEIDTDWKLYSLTYKRDMVDLSRSLGKFLQEHHPSIKNAYQITSAELQAYLDSKAATCVADTLQKILSHIGKLENCCERAYPRSHFRWKTDHLTLPVSTKNAAFVKDTPVPLDVSKTIITAMQGKRSQVGNAFVLSAYSNLTIH